MKRFLLLLGLLLFYICIKSQDINQDVCKYKKAYNYLFNDSILFNGLKPTEINSIVCDSIIYIHKIMFYKQYKEEGEVDRNVFKRVEELDNSRWHSPIFSISISNIFPIKKIKNPLFILYFSKVENNILFCEIMPLHNLSTYSYFENSYFNQSYQYMFIFDENDSIKNVLKEKVAYN